MIFVFSQDDRGLEVFATETEAIQSCEGIDVEDGNYLFWDNTGSPLSPVFTKPNERGKFVVVSGEYSLQPAAEGEQMNSVLSQVAYLEANNWFSKLDDVQKHLDSELAKRRE